MKCNTNGNRKEELKKKKKKISDNFVETVERFIDTGGNFDE